ncbi:MAG: hypothetical protein AB2A00_05190 [Myxococcota bacterium]
MGISTARRWSVLLGVWALGTLGCTGANPGSGGTDGSTSSSSGLVTESSSSSSSSSGEAGSSSSSSSSGAASSSGDPSSSSSASVSSSASSSSGDVGGSSSSSSSSSGASSSSSSSSSGDVGGSSSSGASSSNGSSSSGGASSSSSGAGSSSSSGGNVSSSSSGGPIPSFHCDDNPPTNTASQRAINVPLGVTATAQVSCLPSTTTYWWKSTGSFTAGQLISLSATFAGGTQGDWDFEVGVLDNGTFEAGVPLLNTSCATDGNENCVVELPATADTYGEVYVRAYWYAGGDATFDLTINVVTDDGGPYDCNTDPPLNTHPVRAIAATLGTTLTGQVVCTPLEAVYWWKAAGDFQTGEIIHLQAVFGQQSTSDVDFDVGFLDNGQFVAGTTPAGSGCATQGGEDCLVELPEVDNAPASFPEIYVRARFYAAADDTFDLTLNLVDPNGGDPTTHNCTDNLPLNTRPERAIVVTPGTALATQAACLPVETVYWWKATGSFQTLDAFRLQIDYAQGQQGDVDFHVGVIDADGTFRPGNVTTPDGCNTEGPEDCTTELPVDDNGANTTYDAVYVRGQIYTDSFVTAADATFNLTLTGP